MTPIRVVCQNTLNLALSTAKRYWSTNHTGDIQGKLENPTEAQKKNLMSMKEDVKIRYFDTPDLKHVGKNAYRFVNAVSDFATHSKPLRERANYRESLFARTVDGNAMIDKAYDLLANA